MCVCVCGGADALKYQCELRHTQHNATQHNTKKTQHTHTHTHTHKAQQGLDTLSPAADTSNQLSAQRNEGTITFSSVPFGSSLWQPKGYVYAQSSSNQRVRVRVIYIYIYIYGFECSGNQRCVCMDLNVQAISLYGCQYFH